MSEKELLINLIMRNKYLQQKGSVLSLALEANDLSGPLANYKATTLTTILKLYDQTPDAFKVGEYLEGTIRLIYAAKTKEDISLCYANYLQRHNELLNDSPKKIR